MDQVQIYTDGACLKNPDGPGGYGAVLLLRKNGKLFEKELSGGYANTTNNRMELMAVIVGLEVLKKPSEKLYAQGALHYATSIPFQRWLPSFLWERFF